MSKSVQPSSFFAEHPVFRVEEFHAFHAECGRARRSSASLLRHHVLAGHLVHVRRGLYAAVQRGIAAERASIDPYLIATQLTPNAVVAFHAALQFHGYAYSQWNRYDYWTARRDQPFSFRGLEFVPVLEPASLRGLDDRGGGIEEHRYAGGVVRVTSIERTLVDVLDQPNRCGDWEEIWRSLEMIPFFDLEAVVRFVASDRPAITAARVGFFLEQHREELFVEDGHLAPLRARSPRQPAYLDSRRVSGRLMKDWNLIVSDAVLERQWQELL